MEEDLFFSGDKTIASKTDKAGASPLAYRMRPRSMEEFVGQKHVLGEGKLLRRVIMADRLTSAIFYGPPGSGKTTLAYLISRKTDASFKVINAVASNAQELRKILEQAKYARHYENRKTILFIDEIHRFNKAQQDILMPEVEDGTAVLIGATTHNPFFSVNGPLLSRSLIFELKPLSEEEIRQILSKALEDSERGLGACRVEISAEALSYLAKSACGDARRALNALEVGCLSTPPDSGGKIVFTLRVAEDSVQKKLVYYDHDEDYHYDTASAFIKSMRGSDPDAAIYWLAKMLYAGEDLRFITRRLMILASEDVGNADPQALVVATSAAQACEFVGLPEARIILAQAVIYLALAPKSNASYMALEKAHGDLENDSVQEVPAHLRDASYRGAKKMGHGEGYEYAHDQPDQFSAQEYLGVSKTYYEPGSSGFEKELAERLKKWKSLKNGKNS